MTWYEDECGEFVWRRSNMSKQKKRILEVLSNHATPLTVFDVACGFGDVFTNDCKLKKSVRQSPELYERLERGEINISEARRQLSQ